MHTASIVSSPAAILRQWKHLKNTCVLPSRASPGNLIRRWASLNKLYGRARNDHPWPAVMRRWGAVGQWQTKKQKNVSWRAARQLTAAANSYAKLQLIQLIKLVERSEQRLYPVEEPLRLNFPLHHWLAGDREEAYSDWLAWILGELRSAKSVMELLGKKNIWNYSTQDNDYTVEREIWVPEGHPGHFGRIDCVIRFGKQAILLIEVKVVEAESADLNKNNGYKKWLDIQEPPQKRALLIATGGTKQMYEGDFELVTWWDICRNLRQLIPHLVKENRTILASLASAFVGAVEQNLLGIPSLSWFKNNGSFDNIIAHREQILKTAIYLNQLYNSEVLV